MNLYRARFGKTNGSASWSDWKYYESVDRLKVDLLEAYLDIEYATKSKGSTRDWLGLMLASLWQKALHGDRNVTTHKIFSVEQAVYDQWQPVEVKFTKPEVEIL